MTMPASTTAISFYEQAQPLAEQIAGLARAWRDRAPVDPAAIGAFADFTALAIRVHIRLHQFRHEAAELPPPRTVVTTSSRQQKEDNPMPTSHHPRRALG